MNVTRRRWKAGAGDRELCACGHERRAHCGCGCRCMHVAPEDRDSIEIAPGIHASPLKCQCSGWKTRVWN